MHHASLQFDDQPILKDFNWLVQPGTRIGITGKNGAGKSTLLNIIAGKQKLDSGSIELGETVHLGYYTQMSANLDPNKRIITYLQEVGEEVVQADGQRVSVTQMLEQFLSAQYAWYADWSLVRRRKTPALFVTGAHAST